MDNDIAPLGLPLNQHDTFDNNLWQTDYFASRARFIELGNACGAHMDSHAIAAVGPAREPLTVDVASLTSSDDEHLIILTSGVHGVEGFIGACVQFQALQILAQDGLPPGTGIAMVHAVNPWGFAHLRRVDENNVDVNRNFFGTTPNSHPQYATLDPVINPKTAPNTAGEIKYWINVMKLIAFNLGIAKLFKPIAQGQYDFPKGVFYGGTQLSESTSLLQDLILGLSANAKQITVLDVHSGLGPSATASLIGNTNIVTEEERSSWLNNHYGQGVYIDTQKDNAYNANGTLSRWCQSVLGEKMYLYLCIEIGTVNPIKLFSALRRENQAHHWAEHNAKSTVKAKQSLRDVFAPKSQHWKSKSVEQGLHVLNKTITLPKEHANTN